MNYFKSDKRIQLYKRLEGIYKNVWHIINLFIIAYYILMIWSFTFLCFQGRHFLHQACVL